MRRLMIAWLALVLLFAGRAIAEVADIPGYVAGLGFEARISQITDDTSRCDLEVLGDDSAALTWTGEGVAQTVTGNSCSIARLYVHLLDMAVWDACSASVNGRAVLSYGTDSAERFDTLEQYIAQMIATLGVDPSAPVVPQDVQTYVLNKKSRRFHRPDCPGIVKMSEKNRKEYTGTRDELIDQGYVPCGTCDP